MTSIRQIAANRRNALSSTGPITIEGKRQSRRNAIRHGLLAETVICELEDPEDYEAFQTAIMADYDPQTAVDRELVLRLSNVLWRLRRAAGIETGLFGYASRSDQSGSGNNRASNTSAAPSNREMAENFLRLLQLEGRPLDRLSRYEQRLWRQSRQIIMTIRMQRSSWRNPPARRLPPFFALRDPDDSSRDAG